MTPILIAFTALLAILKSSWFAVAQGGSIEVVELKPQDYIAALIGLIIIIPFIITTIYEVKKDRMISYIILYPIYFIFLSFLF